MPLDGDLRKVIHERSRPSGWPACNHMLPGVHYPHLCFKGDCVKPSMPHCTQRCIPDMLNRPDNEHSPSVDKNRTSALTTRKSAVMAHHIPDQKTRIASWNAKWTQLPIVQPRTSNLDYTEPCFTVRCCSFNLLILKLGIFKRDFGIVSKSQKPRDT